MTNEELKEALDQMRSPDGTITERGYFMVLKAARKYLELQPLLDELVEAFVPPDAWPENVPLCRGSIALGTACLKCPRCKHYQKAQTTAANITTKIKGVMG